MPTTAEMRSPINTGALKAQSQRSEATDASPLRNDAAARVGRCGAASDYALYEGQRAGATTRHGVMLILANVAATDRSPKRADR